MPNENHHSEGAAGKAAYHRQHCSDGMLSHQGEFSWAIPRQDPLHNLFLFGANFHKGAQSTLPGDVSTLPTASLNIFAYAPGVRRKYSGSAEDIFLNLQYMVYFSLRSPKLAYLKYASRLRTVSRHCYVWQGVKSQRHLNEGAAG